MCVVVGIKLPETGLSFWKRFLDNLPAVGVAIVVLTANVPAQRIVAPDYFGTRGAGIWWWSVVRFEHGWPWTYIRREPPYSDDIRGLALWRLTDGVSDISYLALAGDIAVGSVAVGLAAGLWRRWRRRPRIVQYRLAELLALVAAVGFSLAWFDGQRREVQREQRAAARLGEDCELEKQEGGPHWLRDLVGDSFFALFDRAVRLIIPGGRDLGDLRSFRHLQTVQISGEVAPGKQLLCLAECANLEALVVETATDADLRCVGQLKQLSRLILLGGHEITDEGLSYLRSLTNLESLDLAHSAVTGRGLGYLAELKNLQELRLFDTNVGDSGLIHVGKMRRLRRVDLSGCQLTDMGLTHLRRLNHLQELQLCGTSVTDAGLEHLGKMRELKKLDLRGCLITDEGLRRLHGLANLEALWLGDTRVGDAGLECLRGMRRLKQLDLARSRVTNAGLRHLQHLTNLEELSLQGIGVTDDGIDYLRGLTKLERLGLYGARISPEGAAALQRSLPRLRR